MTIGEAIYRHSITLTTKGEVTAIDGERMTLRIGYHDWPCWIDAGQRKRPTVGQHISILGNPTGAPPEAISERYPINVWGWTLERYPIDRDKVIGPQRPRD